MADADVQVTHKNWKATIMPCPRCAGNTMAAGTPTFSRIDALKCTGCGWSLEIEPHRKAAAATVQAAEEQQMLDGP